MRGRKYQTSKKTVTIRSKLIGCFGLTVLVLFAMNLFMFMNINQMLSRVEEVYIENVSLNTLITELESVQSAMKEYLNTKSSDSMEDYYRSEQKLKQSLSKFNQKPAEQSDLLMEKNIYYMSESYLEITNETIQSKRGRLIEKYNISYQEATEIYDYINTYLYSLNNEQFLNNTKNYSRLLTSFRALEAITTIILGMVCLMMLLLIIQLIRSITNPLIDLAKAADEVAGGNLDARLPEVRSHDEVGVVASAFCQMLVSIKQYITQIRESMELESQMKEKELMMEAHLKDAKLKYLQAQIQPHFLFNTLNAGAQLAMMEEADRTYRYIQHVASFYRYNVSDNKGSATILEELQLIDHYIYILNVRYSGDIHFTKQVDESVLQQNIPRMVLQPIVENAVKYGVLQVDYPGEIVLKISTQDEMILICVKDNGAGMTPEQINRVMNEEERSEKVSSDSNGVGLQNVKNRLVLYYNQQNILMIESDGMNQGTTVSIQIPKE